MSLHNRPNGNRVAFWITLAAWVFTILAVIVAGNVGVNLG